MEKRRKKDSYKKIMNKEDLKLLEIKIICPKCGSFMRLYGISKTFWVCEECTYYFDELDENIHTGY